jgi:hypothetical protein
MQAPDRLLPMRKRPGAATGAIDKSGVITGKCQENKKKPGRPKEQGGTAARAREKQTCG